MNSRSILRIHRWIALLFAPLLLLQALTGALLLFHDPLTRLLGPEPSHSDGPAMPTSALVTAAQNDWPGFRLTRLYLPATKNDVAFALLDDGDGTKRYSAIDSGSARSLARGSIWRFPLEAALQIHFELLSGAFGLVIVTANGVMLCLIAASGTWSWWPGWGRIGSSLKIRKNLPARLRLTAYHRSVGPLAFALLLFSGTTGVLLAVPNFPPLGGTPSAPTKSVELSDRQIDAAIATAQSAYPEANMRDIRFAPDGIFAINFFAPRHGGESVDVVTVTAVENRIISTLNAEENPALWLTVLPLHSGEKFGLPGRLLLLAEAAAILFLGISGPLAWWRSRKGKRSIKKQRTNNGIAPSR